MIQQGKRFESMTSKRKRTLLSSFDAIESIPLTHAFWNWRQYNPQHPRLPPPRKIFRFSHSALSHFSVARLNAPIIDFLVGSLSAKGIRMVSRWHVV